MNRLLLTLLCLMLYSELQRRQAECSTALERENVLGFLRGKSNPLVRPDGKGGADTPVVVHIQYNNIRFVDVDAERGKLKTTGFMSLSWTDQRLSYQWMMSYQGHPLNVSSVRIDTDSIWTPDVEVYNTDTVGIKGLHRKNLAVLYPSGHVLWLPAMTFTTFCDPVSEDHILSCLIRLGSWTYSKNDLDLTVQNMVNLHPNATSSPGPWRLVSSSVQLDEKIYPCCPEIYPSVVYTFNFALQDRI